MILAMRSHGWAGNTPATDEEAIELWQAAGVPRERSAILKLAVWGGLDLPLRDGLELEHRLWKRGSAL